MKRATIDFGYLVEDIGDARQGSSSNSIADVDVMWGLRRSASMQSTQFYAVSNYYLAISDKIMVLNSSLEYFHTFGGVYVLWIRD